MKYFVLIAVALLFFGCITQGTPETLNETENTEAEIMKAENGDLVSVDYLGTLDDGSVFDTSIKEEAEKAGLVLRESYSPLEFTVGGGQMIKGFDEAVVGMAVGEEKTVRIPPEEAYGETNPELIMEIPLENIPEGVQVGSVLMASNGAQGTVVEIGNETVKADFNHPLAGQALNFKIIMKEITKQ